MNIKIKLMNCLAQVPVYSHGSDEDAGMDLRSAETIVRIRGGGIVAVSTGVSVEIPSGFMGEIRSRSGLALQGIVCNNAPGTIDPGYRGEIKAILRNQTSEPFYINAGDRIAQLVIVPYMRITWDLAADLKESLRGEAGFGSTGVG